MIAGADPDMVSERALERGRAQLGTLGVVTIFWKSRRSRTIYDEETADVLGLHPGQVTVSIHTGSRGFGYQVCDDYLKVMLKAASKYGITLPDRQLCCAPLQSDEAHAITWRPWPVPPISPLPTDR